MAAILYADCNSSEWRLNPIFNVLKFQNSGLRIFSLRRGNRFQERISGLVTSYSTISVELVKCALEHKFDEARIKLSDLDSVINAIEDQVCNLSEEFPDDTFWLSYMQPIVVEIPSQRILSRITPRDTRTLFQLHKRLAEIGSTITYWTVRLELKMFLSALKAKNSTT
jgi:hypothetical protein